MVLCTCDPGPQPAYFSEQTITGGQSRRGRRVTLGVQPRSWKGKGAAGDGKGIGTGMWHIGGAGGVLKITPLRWPLQTARTQPPVVSREGRPEPVNKTRLHTRQGCRVRRRHEGCGPVGTLRRLPQVFHRSVGLRGRCSALCMRVDSSHTGSVPMCDCLLAAQARTSCSGSRNCWRN